MSPLPDPQPALLLMAAFSRYPEALRWTEQQIAAHWGPLALVSPQFEFTQTDYYEPTMGPGLLKQFFACEQLTGQDALPALKLQTGSWEAEYAAEANVPEPRPLNLDPGLITLGKLLLASTKDHAHRIYLGRGIFAEVTLHLRHGRWEPWPWTFPDYRRADYQAFFDECRSYLRLKLRK